MEQLSWTGAIGTVLDPILLVSIIILVMAAAITMVRSFAAVPDVYAGDDGALAMGQRSLTILPTLVGAVIMALALAIIALFVSISLTTPIMIALLVIGAILAVGVQIAPTRLTDGLFPMALLPLVISILAYLVLGVVSPSDTLGIVGNIMGRFTPVWVGMIAIIALSIMTKSRTGLYGKLFDSTVGTIGFSIVLFWILTALLADMIALYDSLEQISGMKNKKPGWPVSGQEGSYYLLGGDNLARDVFSRVVKGSQTVLAIAPAATVFAFMVGITLGLPAGYFGGRLDTLLSFLANMVLAFPVILLFYLLVTPEIRETGIPIFLAAVLFLFPIVFFAVLVQTKLFTQPNKMWMWMALVLVLGFWAYSGLAFNADPLGVFSMDPNLLNIFVSVVFVNSPTVFRIVRGLTMDIKTRDYVAAAQTRGEGPWYIMLWEILPNARGPLIVDFCLRIGYTTILLGTLGFFGLGVSPESPDWGMTINEGRKLLSIYPHPALPPALALMSLVLGLNLLADGLREQSLKD